MLNFQIMNPNYQNPQRQYDQRPPQQLQQYPQPNTAQQGKANYNQPNPHGINQYSVTVAGQAPQNTPNQHV